MPEQKRSVKYSSGVIYVFSYIQTRSPTIQVRLEDFYKVFNNVKKQIRCSFTQVVKRYLYLKSLK